MSDEQIADLSIERMPLALMPDHPRTPRDPQGQPKWGALVRSARNEARAILP